MSKIKLSKYFLLVFILLTNTSLFSQETKNEEKAPSFWDHVNIGGGVGLNVGNGIFSASISPSAVYNFNEYISAGPGLHFSYQDGRNFTSTLYGGSFIVLANPIPQIQLSVDMEQLRYSINGDNLFVQNNGSIVEVPFTEKGWNTALFLGGGYRAGPATVGIRYNVLFNDNDNIYATAWAPFVRVFF